MLDFLALQTSQTKRGTPGIPQVPIGDEGRGLPLYVGSPALSEVTAELHLTSTVPIASQAKRQSAQRYVADTWGESRGPGFESRQLDSLGECRGYIAPMMAASLHPFRKFLFTYSYSDHLGFIGAYRRAGVRRQVVSSSAGSLIGV